MNIGVTSNQERSFQISQLSKISVQDEHSSTYINELKYLQHPWSLIPLKKRISPFFLIFPSSLLLSLTSVVSASQFTLGYLVCTIIKEPSLSIAYGVSIFLGQMTFVMIANANEEAIAITVGKFYGANLPEKAKQWLTNSITTMLFINFILVAFFLFYGRQALILIGFDPELAANCYRVLLLCLPMYLLFAVNNGLLSYILSVETEVEYLSLAPISVCINFALTLALAYWTKLGFYSAIIGLILIQITDFSIYIWIYFSKMNKDYRGLGSFKESLSTLTKFLKEFAIFWVGLLGEYAGWEMMVYIAVLTKDNDQIAAVTYVVNIAYYIANFGIGQTYISRSVITSLLGAKKKEAAKKFTGIYLIGLFLIGALFGCTLYFSARYVASIYTMPGTKLRDTTIRLLKMYSFWVPQDVLFFCMLTIARTIGAACLSIVLNCIFVLGLQPIISIWLYYKHHLSCYTVLATMYSMFTICFVILAITFYNKNWQKVDVTEEEEDTTPHQVLLPDVPSISKATH